MRVCRAEWIRVQSADGRHSRFEGKPANGECPCPLRGPVRLSLKRPKLAWSIFRASRPRLAPTDSSIPAMDSAAKVTDCRTPQNSADGCLFSGSGERLHSANPWRADGGSAYSPERQAPPARRAPVQDPRPLRYSRATTRAPSIISTSCPSTGGSIVWITSESFSRMRTRAGRITCPRAWSS
jgi:hypothetical protein